MQNGRINSPSLDLACPQRKTISKNMSTCLEIEVSIKTKYGHGSIMLIFIKAKKSIMKLYHITSYEQITIHHNIEVESINFIENQQTMFSVNFATTIHHIFRKGLVSEPLGKSTYSPII